MPKTCWWRASRSWCTCGGAEARRRTSHETSSGETPPPPLVPDPAGSMESLMSPWPYPRVLAHRGGGAFAPENTIAAIRTGRERGFRGVEFDVTLSADDEPVLMHDPTLDRTTDASGPVAARSWAELARLDAGRWFSPGFAGEPIPRLSDALGYC